MTARNGTSSKRPSERIRVLVVDDHPAIRETLADTIEGKIDMELCGEACSTVETLQQVEELDPDVAVVDVTLGDEHGLDLVQNIRAQFPETRVVVFSMHNENIYAERAIAAGAAGYLMKSEPTQSVIDAIRSAHRGEVYLSRRMTSRILGNVALNGASGPQFAVDELTEREMAVFRMLGKGATVEEMESRLDLSRKTVETYRRRAKEKLGLDSVNDLLQYAVQWTSGQVQSEKDVDAVT